MNKITLFNFLVTLDCWISVVSCQEKAEQPDVIDIESLTHNGSGCPLNNSVGFFISDDRTALTLLFDDYDVMMGPEISMRESRKNCHINVGLRVPQGWSYSIASVYYDRGYLDLEEGTYSTQGTRFYFSNKDKRTERLETRWEGPLELDYSIREYFQLDKLVWSACGAPDNLNIVSDIRVAGDRSKTAYSVPSYLDGIVSHMYELQWQQC